MGSADIKIFRAYKEHLSLVAPLFNEYRIWYGQSSGVKKCRRFLQERLRNTESVIFAAVFTEGKEIHPVGFVQLYPSFSSISLKPIWVLNDLYVHPKYRRKGVARKLVAECKRLAKETGAKGLALETANDNQISKSLYVAENFVKDEEFEHFFWMNEKS